MAASRRSGRWRVTRGRLALVPVGVAVFSLLAHATPRPAFEPDVRPVAARPARGKLLVADRNLRGGGFAHSVVLLVNHDARGSMGLIVNRPSPIKLAEVLPSRDDVKERGDGLWVGGPVQPTRILLLARAPERLLDGLPVFDEVQLILTRRGLDHAFGMGIPPAAVRAYAGYTGWGPGELDREIARGDWHVVDAKVPAVFNDEPSELWTELIGGAAGRWVRVEAPLHAPT